MIENYDDDFPLIQAKLAKNLIAFRNEFRLSQEALSFKANIDRTSIQNIELMKSNPSLKTISKLASALGISVEKLII